MADLAIAEQHFNSRLWLGSSLYPSPTVMLEAFAGARPGVVTLSLRRQTAGELQNNSYWQTLKIWAVNNNVQLLPNTAGCHSAKEAILLAHMARELFSTSWIKLEVIGDEQTLQPHPFELVRAAEQLVNDGFNVLPYCTDDLILCRELLAIGCPAVMPWAAPIGTGKGLLNRYQLQTLRQRLPDAVLIIDAGIGKPSQAMEAMELGFDGVLLNTAVARAIDPVAMAQAFKAAVEGGRIAWQAGLMVERSAAAPSTPSWGLPFGGRSPREDTL